MSKGKWAAGILLFATLVAASVSIVFNRPDEVEALLRASGQVDRTYYHSVDPATPDQVEFDLVPAHESGFNRISSELEKRGWKKDGWNEPGPPSWSNMKPPGASKSSGVTFTQDATWREVTYVRDAHPLEHALHKLSVLLHIEKDRMRLGRL